MRVRPPAPVRRLGAFALAVCALALAFSVPGLQSAPLVGAATLSREQLVPDIIGGRQTPIDQVPWQVYVEGGLFEAGGKTFTTFCGGSILDSTHILTAAHCTDAEGTTNGYPAEIFKVLAGDSDDKSSSATTQERAVASIRRDPLYTTSPIGDDVAIMTLKTPLELSAAKHAEPISLVASGATPAPGTSLEVSGYGKEQGPEADPPTGELFSTTLTAIGSDACRNMVGPNSAVLLCAVGSDSSFCEGDSGSALTEGNPPVQVGIVDYGSYECPVDQPNVFTNVAAPEIRAFIEGDESPPVAARPISPPVIKTSGSLQSAPVDFGPLTCEPGGWSGSPSYRYTFQTENANVLQSSSSNVFTPPASLLGVSLVCVVQAYNTGGVATNRSASTPPIAADTGRPTASITTLKCHLRTCTLSVLATDPNGVALKMTASASYQVPTKCHLKKGQKRARGKRPICHKTDVVHMSVSAISAGVFKTAASKLPYNRRLTFTVLINNAASLRPVRSPTRSTTLHPPRPGEKKR
ncbi:MAG: serine protease [Solirubrobacteraceae bacterium]